MRTILVATLLVATMAPAAQASAIITECEDGYAFNVLGIVTTGCVGIHAGFRPCDDPRGGVEPYVGNVVGPCLFIYP